MGEFIISLVLQKCGLLHSVWVFFNTAFIQTLYIYNLKRGTFLTYYLREPSFALYHLLLQQKSSNVRNRKRKSCQKEFNIWIVLKGKLVYSICFQAYTDTIYHTHFIHPVAGTFPPYYLHSKKKGTAGP